MERAGARIASQIAIGVLFLLYAIPLFAIILASFKSNSDVVNNPMSLIFTPTLEAYHKVLNGGFLVALGNSFIVAAGTTALVLVVAIPLSYVLSRIRPGWGAVIIGVLIGLQMLPAPTAIIPQYRVTAQLGLLGSLGGVVVAMSALALPYAVLILRPFFLGVPGEIEEAAQVDGAGYFRTFASIVFPLVRNGVSLVGVLLFISAWGDFLHPVSFLNVQSRFPLSVLILQQEGVYGTEWNNLMALALVGAIPTVIIFAFVARRLTAGLALGIGK